MEPHEILAYRAGRASARAMIHIIASPWFAGCSGAILAYLYFSRAMKSPPSESDDDERKEAGWLEDLWKDATLEDAEAAYREWHDPAWRQANGWLGSDFIHSRSSKGPRVLRYFWDKQNKMLVGAVIFGPNSESHAGLCHGGSMTAVLDDVLGHTAFIANGKGPWSGATVVCNCTLKKPVRIGQVLKVWGRVKERRGRKSLIEGGLVAEDGAVHALLDGVTVECTREKLLS